MMVNRFLDIQKQGFMKPAKTRKPKKEPPTVRCADCQNWHKENKHTSPPEVRRANRKKQVLEYRALVRQPGRFKGEAPYVPYFWHAAMDGRAEEDGGVLTFAVTSKDKAACGRDPHAPYRIYSTNGRVTMGCVDAIHGDHLIGESARWHNRAEAKQIRMGELRRLSGARSRRSTTQTRRR